MSNDQDDKGIYKVATKNVRNAGFVRITDVMVRMLDAAEATDKESLVRLSEAFAEDSADFVSMLCSHAGVSQDDILAFSVSDTATQNLVKTASEVPKMQITKTTAE